LIFIRLDRAKPPLTVVVAAYLTTASPFWTAQDGWSHNPARMLKMAFFWADQRLGACQHNLALAATRSGVLRDRTAMVWASTPCANMTCATFL
jgi:uncharacterized protein involved in response to NO